MVRFAFRSCRSVCWPLAAALLGIGAGWCLAGPSRATAADIEIRDFAIQVDGKPAGEYHLTVRRQDDTLAVAAQSDVCVRVLGIKVYTYSYRGTEIWKSGRLQHFTCGGKENSKTFAVTAAPAGDVLRITANGQERTTRPDVWLTSCWQLPDAKFRNQQVPLLGCDNGQYINGFLQYVGNDRLPVAGQPLDCSHYRLTNVVPHELWYDGQERMVRQAWTADGHTTVLELTAIRH